MRACDKQLGGFVGQLGARIFSPDDWIVRITLVDGSVRVVGVQPECGEELAVQIAMGHAMLSRNTVKDIAISRRRKSMRAQT